MEKEYKKEEKRVGLYGLGTVGSGVVELLLKKRRIESGIKFTLKKIFEKDVSKFKKFHIPSDMQSFDFDEILEDSNIDIVIELIGGINPAKEIILRALENGKDVITANKALVAEEFKLIFSKAREKGRKLGFNASLLGASPLLKTLNADLVAGKKLQKISGVLNGTTNYILTQMEKGSNFDEALKKAQVEGYAEYDATLDIEGMDTAHKICILLNSVYGVSLKPNAFPVEGIKKISLEDIKFAEELGYKIRLLATMSYLRGKYDIRVCPYLVPKNHIFSFFEGVQNGIEVRSIEGGVMGYEAAGAGKYPAAYAVVNNLTSIYQENGFPLLEDLKKNPSFNFEVIDNVEFRYYLKFNVIDKVGVLSKISSIFAKFNISIDSVIQKGKENAKIVPLVLITHKAKEGSLQKAIKEIDRLDVVKQKTALIRLFD